MFDSVSDALKAPRTPEVPRRNLIPSGPNGVLRSNLKTTADAVVLRFHAVFATLGQGGEGEL